MKRKHKRLTFVLIGLAAIGVAVGLMLSAFEDGIVYFYSPTQMTEKELPSDRRLRLGGLVEEESVKRTDGSTEVAFKVTDLSYSIPVVYDGILPDLFREGQGVVAEGYLINGQFKAEEVLAKHDENYMPPEVAEALKESGKWDKVKGAMKHEGPPAVPANQ
ncbi:cytochrome c maturation protein CcmE [Magnetospira sp. QH-2]|uniref:cytochrome c maturation protein CcmE n=1 Tax=Magnetospira sp. (strain QH-2) TaxID=1288970 RepID=UPI0003E80C25|nr:cytochrome c maturation protein CcmE [Magnetospira sp. QH-2]CCQ75360.1 Cytochrome c-type biogenesis protein CcmE [Magnetospira sp. QH-2]